MARYIVSICHGCSMLLTSHDVSCENCNSVVDEGPLGRWVRAELTEQDARALVEATLGALQLDDLTLIPD